MKGRRTDDGDLIRITYDVTMTGGLTPEQIGEALGNQIADDLEALDPGGKLPVTIGIDVTPPEVTT